MSSQIWNVMECNTRLKQITDIEAANIINPMKQRPWDAASSSTGQQISHLLQNLWFIAVFTRSHHLPIP
jgi:hypothetical protein